MEMQGNKKPVELPSMEQIAKERTKLKRRRDMMKSLFTTISVLVVIAAVSVLIANIYFPVLQVSGSSMEPVFEDGEILVLYKTDKFETGDLIGFYYQSKVLLKRAIGSAGDFVNIEEDGTVFVNDVEIDEPYVAEKSLGTCDIELPYQVPDGQVFVMGDHRETSIDSRSTEIGCVKEDQLVGKVVFRVWPLKKIGIVH